MQIEVNGQPRQVPDGSTVLTLLGESGLKPQNVAVELNRRILRSERYGEPLKEGDKVEIVTFVGGGA